MKRERMIVLRVLTHAVDSMGYWEESKYYYAEDGDDIEAINKEIEKISIQIIDRYGLNRVEW